MTFGEKIQSLRKEAGLSQKQLAERLDVSRQAISKWERDAGYPGTEKLVRMSRLFGVSLDYLLSGDDGLPRETPEHDDVYISEEAARGFLDYRKRKSLKKGLALCALCLGMALIMTDSGIGEILFVLLVISGALLFVSIFRNSDPYWEVRLKPLRLETGLREKLSAEYGSLRGRANVLSLAGLAMILAGLLLPPFIDTGENYMLDNLLLEAGLAITGAGAFLWVYFSGLMKAYIIILTEREYHEKEN